MKDIDDYYNQKRAIGQRFKQFRELVGKSRKQMEQEANNPLINVERINMFEHGAIIPDIIFIQYFTETYGLNLNWLVTGNGNPLFKNNKNRMTEFRLQRKKKDRK